MPEALRDIPVNLIIGRRGATKGAVVAGFLGGRPAGSRWAALYNDLAPDASTEAAPRGVYINRLADGCICCSAQAGLRVALTRLLREARPQRLLIEPSSQAHIQPLLQLLADRWLAPVLEVRATVLVIDGAHHVDGGFSDLDRQRMCHADIIAFHGVDGEQATAACGLLSDLRKFAPAARLVTTANDLPDPGLLDLPGRIIRPRFHSDG